jgi:heat shock protein HslJ
MDDTAPDGPPLGGTSWHINQVADDQGRLLAVDTSHRQPGLAFDETNRVAGSTGCNSFMGRCTIAGSEIEFGPLATTMMMCHDSAMTLERLILAALGAARRWSVDGVQLTLLGEPYPSDPAASVLLVAARPG